MGRSPSRRPRTGRPCCGRGGEASVKTCGGGAGATEAKCALSRDRGLEGASRPRQEESLVALEERSLGQAATGVASVVPAAAGRVSRWQREISTAAAVQKACRHLSQEEAAVLVEKAFFLRAKRGDLLRPRQEAAPVTTTRWPALQWAERIFAATSQETCCRHGERKMPIVAATRGFLSRGHGGEASIVSRL